MCQSEANARRNHTVIHSCNGSGNISILIGTFRFQPIVSNWWKMLHSKWVSVFLLVDSIFFFLISPSQIWILCVSMNGYFVMWNNARTLRSRAFQSISFQPLVFSVNANTSSVIIMETIIIFDKCSLVYVSSTKFAMSLASFRVCFSCSKQLICLSREWICSEKLCSKAQ